MRHLPASLISFRSLYAAAFYILHRAEVELPLSSGVFGDLRQPQFVRRGAGEIPLAQVVVDRRPGLRFRPRFLENRPDAVVCAQPPDPVLTCRDAPFGSSSAMKRYPNAGA